MERTGRAQDSAKMSAELLGVETLGLFLMVSLYNRSCNTEVRFSLQLQRWFVWDNI